MPPCPMCKKAHPSMCGLKLFGSENECPICMEQQSDMVALPCGHQFCAVCIGRVGIRVGPPVQTRPSDARPSGSRGWAGAMARAARSVRPPPLTMTYQRTVGNSLNGRTPLPLTVIQRHVQRRFQSRAGRAPRRRRRRVQRKRCGWCGHIGHTQRKCTTHRQHCGCATYKSARHKRLYQQKPKCPGCNKRGHWFRTCANIIKGFK